MINELFTLPSTIERLRQGPLSENLDAYAAAVAEQGYAHHSIGRQIVAIADFSRWLKHKQIPIEALDDQVVDRFLQHRRRRERVGRGDPKALDRMLSMLRQKGIVKPCPPVADNACSKIAAGFHSYLVQELGRSPSTAKNYVPLIGQFLQERFQNRTPDLALLRAPDVTGFVTRHAHQLSPVRAGIMVTALRSFFRYLLHRGAIATDLAGCVPTVPNWSLSTLQLGRVARNGRSLATARIGRQRSDIEIRGHARHKVHICQEAGVPPGLLRLARIGADQSRDRARGRTDDDGMDDREHRSQRVRQGQRARGGAAREVE